MDRSEIWDKQHEYCSENVKKHEAQPHAISPFSLQYECYSSQNSTPNHATTCQYNAFDLLSTFISVKMIHHFFYIFVNLCKNRTQ